MINRIFFVISLIFISLSTNAQEAAKAENISKDVVRMFNASHSDSIVFLFDEAMTKAMPKENLKLIWPSFIASDGDFQKVDVQKTKTYQGYLMVETNLIFERKSYTMRLAFNAKSKIAGMFFIPIRTTTGREKHNINNQYYREENITIKTGTIKLPGTLTVPKGLTHFPIVVFVHGSGPNDRNETIGPNKIFQNLAHELAKKGIASIRYDKRTYIIKTTGDTTIPYSGFEQVVIEDAVSALKLAQRTVTQGDKVFLLGHSLGAYLAPEIANRVPNLGGVIMMAGNSLPLEDIVVYQYKYLYKRDGYTCAERKDIRALKKKAKNVKKIETFLSQKIVPELPLTNDTAFWRDVHRYKPLEAIMKLQMPVLILQGERDYQVTMENFELWKTTVGGKKNYEFKSYPKLNHIFHEGEGKSYPEEYNTLGNIPSYVMSDIGTWILNNN